MPDLRGNVDRDARVKVHYLDRNGMHTEVMAEGLSAGTSQHEVDHLDGVLFLDRVTDPTTCTTWEQFEHHHRDAFLRRAASYLRDGGA